MSVGGRIGSVLDEVGIALAGLASSEPHAVASLLADARLQSAAAAAGSWEDAAGRVAMLFAARALPALAQAADWTYSEAATALARCARTGGMAEGHFALAVGLAALADRRILGARPHRALELELDLLVRVAPLEHVSVWRVERPQPPALLAVRGRPVDDSIRAAAAAPDNLAVDTVVAVPVRTNGANAGVLVAVVAANGDRGLAVPLAEQAAAICGLVFEQVDLLTVVDAERRLTEAAEKRLVRLGFDIHDAPMQTIAAIRRQLALLSERIEQTPADEPRARARLASLAHELEEYAAAADHELRDLVQSIQKPTVLGSLLDEVLRDEVARFAARTRIEASLDIAGDLETLTSSQQHALLRIAQESLSNVERHSAASSVRISFTARDGEVRGEIVDDGRGFDVERAFTAAAREGRMGLHGMMERARLLGGTLAVTSRPGGPTLVRLSLPGWSPGSD